MKEHFLARGKSQLWLDSSLDALRIAGFINIDLDENNKTIVAQKNGYISLRINDADANQTLIEIESQSEENLDDFKFNVGESFLKLYTDIDFNNLLPKAEVLTQIDEEKEDEVFEFDLEQPEEKTDPSEDVFSISMMEDFLEDSDASSNKTTKKTQSTQEFLSDESNRDKDDSLSIRTPWYFSKWFIIILFFLLPPLGIFIMWYKDTFKPTIKIAFTFIFGIYTLFWTMGLTLLSIKLVEYNDNDLPKPLLKQEQASQMEEEIKAYWDNEKVKEYNEKIPELISEFNDLYNKGNLSSADDKKKAKELLTKFDELSSGVLKVTAVSKDNAAYDIQRAVNKTAQSFNKNTTSYLKTLDSDAEKDIAKEQVALKESEVLFYKIDFNYNKTMEQLDEVEKTEETEEK